MKKFNDVKRGWLVVAAALTMGVAACSSSDEGVAEKPQPTPAPTQPKTYTLAVTASKGGDNATTRALSYDSQTASLIATWATGEKIYVKKADGEWSADKYLQPQDNAATTTIKGTLTGMTIAKDDELVLQFPKAGAIGYAGQKGTLADIAANFDWATASIIVESVSATGNITPTSTTAAPVFENHQAIVRFTLLDKENSDAPINNPSTLKVFDGANEIASLTNIPVDTYEANNATNVLYVAIPGFSKKNITITATVGDDTYIYEPSESKTFTNGKYYSITMKMNKITDLSRTESANCYMVKADGAYMFKATVRGNGKADCAGISKTIDPATISSASLVWATYNTDRVPSANSLIKNVRYSDGYVYFSKPGGTGHGNALLAIKDVEGNILWSWHLWICGYQEEYKEGVNGVKMMDRNLGALSTHDNSDYLCHGMFYQWGRKDPFIRPYYFSSTPTGVWGTAKTVEEGSVSVAAAIQNPTVFYVVVKETNRWDTGDNWCSSDKWRTLWVGGTKTIFDPCPPGWRVPSSDEVSGMSILFSYGNYFEKSGYFETNGGYAGFSTIGAFWMADYYLNLTKIQYVGNKDNNYMYDRSPVMGYSIRPVKDE